jgi:hypothetical protein
MSKEYPAVQGEFASAAIVAVDLFAGFLLACRTLAMDKKAPAPHGDTAE